MMDKLDGDKLGKLCRVCLNKSKKRYNIYQFQLNIAYETLTGFEVSPDDGAPQTVCSVCSSLLLKWYSFRELCHKSQGLLNMGYLGDNSGTRSIDLKVNVLFNFGITANETLQDYIHDCKDEYVDDDLNNIVDNEENDIIKNEIEESPVYLEDLDSFNDFQDISDVISEVEVQDTQDIVEDDDIETIVLTKQQQIEEVQARKLSANYLNSFYKCDLCYKGYMTDATYKNHMIRHDESSGSHACEVCFTRWPHLTALKSHVIIAHEKRFCCKLCSHVSKSKHRAKEHFKWHSGHVYVCKMCGNTFEKSTSYLTHLRLQHPSEHMCEVCGASFIGKNGLNMHMKKSHRGFETIMQCGRCKSNFRTTEALERHNFNDPDCDDDSRPCLECGEKCDDDEKLQEHMKFHEKKEQVKCMKCHKKFATERSFAIHFQRTHMDCDIKKVKKDTHSDKHVAVCEICGRRCISKANLIYHQRIHTGEKPYPCTFCVKKFANSQRLQIHIRTHTGESPYQCSHCPKSFKHKAALNRHDRVHTGEKPYECPHCGKCFSQSNSMKLHVRTVHLKLPAPYRGKEKMMKSIPSP